MVCALLTITILSAIAFHVFCNECEVLINNNVISSGSEKRMAISEQKYKIEFGMQSIKVETNNNPIGISTKSFSFLVYFC
jgi:hypothetical protein